MVDADAIREYDDRVASDDARTTTVALGCFWGPDAAFGAMDGVVRTRVGYAGGTTSDPTYHDVGDHSEAVQVEYDPARLAFSDVIRAAMERHDPRRQPRERQYQNVLFYESPAEREAVEASLEGVDGGAVETRVEPLTGFTLAEDYHQKYSLGSERAILAAFEAAGYDADAIRDSPAAAKLNASAAGREIPPTARL